MDSTKINAVFLGILVLIAFGTIAKLLSAILIPLVLAILFSFILAPLLNIALKLKIPRVLAVIIIILMIAGFLYLFGIFIYSAFSTFAKEFPKYESRMRALFESWFVAIEDATGLEAVSLIQIDWIKTVQGYVVSISGGVMGFLKSLGLILIFLIFLLMERPVFARKMKNAFIADTNERLLSILTHMNQQIAKYLSLKFIISLGTGVLCYITLLIIGMDFPLVWSVLAFLLNFIPNIGSLIFVGLSVLMSFVQFSPQWGYVVAVSISMTAIQLVMGNIVDPALQGDRLNVSPFFILVSLIFWGWLWGIVGMFLAVPLLVIIKIVCENIPFLHPVGVLIGAGREH